MRAYPPLLTVSTLLLLASPMLTGCSDSESVSRAVTKKPRRVSPSTGRFEIVFPPPFNNVEESTETASTRLGDMDITMFFAVQNDGTFGVTMNIYPNELFEEKTVEAIFDEAQVAAAKSHRGSVKSKEAFAYHGNPGRRFYVEGVTRTGKAGYSRFDFILVKPRMYVINVNHINRKFLDSEKAKAFFGSFKVVE